MEENRQSVPEAAPKHVPTPEEIARAEAEAVRALQRGEAPARPALPAEAPEAPAEPAGAWENVPYVDDVPEPPKSVKAAAPEDAPEDDDEDDTPYEPGPWEKRINALPEDKWNLYQTIGGAALGVVAILILSFGGEDLGSWALIIAVVLAMVVPRYLERWLRRKMNRGRMAMLIAMLVMLVVVFVVNGANNGFQIFAEKPQ